MSRRRLSDEERTLWKGVMRSVKPLRTRVADEADDADLSARPRESGDRGPPTTGVAAPGSRFRGNERRESVKVPSAAPPLAALGRRLKKRVARGTHTIDVRIDLHGMTQSEAHLALLGFLRSAQARGASIALVITGKGGGGAYGERGVLRRQVPLWLRLPEFRGLIVGFENAGAGHGGEGALYLRLRKSRGE